MADRTKIHKANLGRKPDAPFAPAQAIGYPWCAALLLTTLVIPWNIPIGPLRITPFRLVLCVMLVPCIWLLARQKAGSIKAGDISVALFAVWGASSLYLNNAGDAAQPLGVLVVETLTPYFIARAFIRDANHFHYVAKLMFVIVSSLLPFAFIEALTGWKVLLSIFSAILPTYPTDLMEERGGLWRVQGPFEHPILFGLFCSSSFALTFMVLGHQGATSRWFRAAIVATTTLLSVSSGPVLSLLFSIALMAWKWLSNAFRGPGLTLAMWGLALLALGAELFSRRSLVEILVTEMTFDSMSYWSRSLIWDYAWRSTSMHPWLGVGLGPWAHPAWLHPSIDNFWLFTAVRYGLPAAVLIACGVIACLWIVWAKRGLNEVHARCRAAYLTTVTSYCLVGFTVHFWDATYVLFMFLLGSGMWIADVAAHPNEARQAIQPRRRRASS